MARKTKKRLEAWNAFAEDIKRKATAIMQSADPHPMGHFFLWAVVNDGTLCYRTCLGSGCAEDIRGVQEKVEALPGVSYTTINMD